MSPNRRTDDYKRVKKHIDRAKKEAKEALDNVQGVTFDDEQVELLESERAVVQGMLRLAGLALKGADLDWDAELAAFEERRQWGPEGKPDDYIEEPEDLRRRAAIVRLKHRLTQRRNQEAADG